MADRALARDHPTRDVTGPVRVFLADDHALMREGLRAVLEAREGFQVVGQAADGHQALRGIVEQSPDVVLMDIAMPGLNGIEVARRLRQACPGAKIVALSMYDDRQYAAEILRAGAAGYLLKDAAGSELIDAIRTVLRGERYLCPAMAGKLIEDYLRLVPADPDTAGPDELTAREREVLQLVAEGASTRAAADRLGISPKTVEVHRAHIAAKLGIATLPGLVRYAIRRGIVKP
jgi:DNA-binding NarL/FixJ family response regulator